MSDCLLLTFWFPACCPPNCRPLAPNEAAAWRGGGFHCRLDELHSCKVTQNFGRDKAAILPNCTLHAGIFFDSHYPNKTSMIINKATIIETTITK